MKYLTRTIWILSLVSLFTDISSEMLYPVMPLFLASIGFSSVLIGLLEGMAEATAGLSKGYFGRISDAAGKRLPFVQWGYLLSAISKPMMAVWVHPLWIFSARTMDRLGKGIRTGARDAVLSAETNAANKGKVFGFHRSMDTLGAAIGPALALLFLAIYPHQYKWLFVLAFAPALLGTALTFVASEQPAPPHPVKKSFRLTQAFDYLKTAPASYRLTTLALLLFALFNSSDLFLLMKLEAAGLNDTAVIGCYILYNLVFALAAFPLGHLADRIGFKKTLLGGWLLFALVYAGFSRQPPLYGFAALLVLYGFYAAATDGISKALLSNLVPSSESASALGTFAGLNSMMALLASTFAGVIWKYISPEAVFLFSATGAILTMFLLWFIPIDERHTFA